MDMQEEVEQSNVDSADNVSPEVSSKAEPTLSNSRALPTSINTLDPSNAVSQTATDALPFDLSTSIGSIDISGNSGESSSMVTGTSPTHVDVGNLSAALDLNFNVDSLNLDNLSALSGLDFDVSSLLTQMNSQAETDPAISSALEISDAPTSAALPSEASIALITTEFSTDTTLPSTAAQQPVAKLVSKPAPDIQTTTLPSTPAVPIPAAPKPTPAAPTSTPAAPTSTPAAPTSIPAAPTSTPSSIRPSNFPHKQSNATSPAPLVTADNQKSPIKPPVATNTPQLQGNSSQGLVRPANTARPVRPAASIVGSSMPSSVPAARPRPMRPLNAPGAAASIPGRPSLQSAGGPLASVRPSTPTGAAGTARPSVPRTTQGPQNGARPRPAPQMATAAAPGPNATRPATRPAARPRPSVRPALPGAQPATVRSPVPGRPPAPRPGGVRPGVRPTSVAASGPGSPRASSSAVRPNSSGSVSINTSATLGTKVQPPATPISPISQAPSSALASMQSPSIVEARNTPSQKQQQSPTLQAPSNMNSTLAPTGASATAMVTQSAEEQQNQQSAASEATALEPGAIAESAVSEEERYLTETVTVVCPPLIAPSSGLELLYSLAGAFRSLCHGVAPTNAEWSSLNVLAVAWPQLEIAPTAGRRLAQRDISDVSSMTAVDSMRLFEARRPPSSAIHLYRLHAHPPSTWDVGLKLCPIQPSLLPLCDLRMQQQWDEQASRANMDRLMDTFAIRYPEFPQQQKQKQQKQQQHDNPSLAAGWPCNTVNVSPLSGWHGGASQAGMGERMRVASAPRCAWSTDCRMLAASDRAGRFEIFKVDDELNSWQSVYHIDFDHPVISFLWLANTRKYGISRRKASTTDSAAADLPSTTTTATSVAAPIASLSTHQVNSVPMQRQSIKPTTTDSSSAREKDSSASLVDAIGSPGSWDVDPNIYIRRLPFFGPRNTQGEYALIVLTADGQLVLVYQRDEKWVRVVSPLEPRRRDPKSSSHKPTADNIVQKDSTDPAAVDDDGTGADQNNSTMDDPWSNIPKGYISHADMMLVSKKWIYLAAHRAGASPVEHPHEPGAIPDELKQGGKMMAPTVEVYRIQVEFASDYSPRLFATPLVVQPITLPLGIAAATGKSDSDMDVDSGAFNKGLDEDVSLPRVTHIKLITALNPEVRPVEKNILGEEHYFPLLFVSLGKLAVDNANSTLAASHGAFTTFIQVWRLEGAPHAQKSVIDLLRRPPPLRLSHMWTEQRRGLLLSVIANRAERQQLRYLFAKPSDKDYRALMLTWGDGKVEMLRNYQEHDSHASDSECFDQCVQPIQSLSEWVIGSVLSPHYTAYFQLVMRPWTVELGKKHSDKARLSNDSTDTLPADSSNGKLEPGSAVSCAWNQGHAHFRLGWTPFFSDFPEEQQQQQKQQKQQHRAGVANGKAKNPMNAHVQAYCGDLFAVRILNKEDPTDLVAILANMATYEENQLMPNEPQPTLDPEEADDTAANATQTDAAAISEGTDSKKDSDVSSKDKRKDGALSIPTSRTLSQALYRASTLLANALGIKSLDLDPLASTTPFVRRLLGAIMQIHYLAQHDIQAASLGIMLHIASVVDARLAIVHEHIIQSMSDKQTTLFDMAKSFSDRWIKTFPSSVALVLWCIDLFAALTRDTYLYFNVRCPDSEGLMRPLCELSGAADVLIDRERSYVQTFEGKTDENTRKWRNRLGNSCLLSGGLPCRLALLFHRPTFDAIRNLMTFVAFVEYDLLNRIRVLNSLPPGAANIPEYANMVRSRNMVVSTAQQLAHALEYLPVSIQRMKDFFAEVQDLYVSDKECASLSAQTMLVSTSTITGPFRKYLPQLARSFLRFILEPDVLSSSAGKPASPSALVLHDTRWMNIVMCRSNIPGIVDGTSVFETPWRVAVPVAITDPKLIETDEDALVPAAELAEWEREKSEFERALDEDNVLFDIDDPGFIFFDTSSGVSETALPETSLATGIIPQAGVSELQPTILDSSASNDVISDAIAGIFQQSQYQQQQQPGALPLGPSNTMFDIAVKSATLAPVKITTKVPDFSDVLGLYTASSQGATADTDADYLFNMSMFFDTAVHAPTTHVDFNISETGSSSVPPTRQSYTRSNSVATHSPCMTPRTTGGSSTAYLWTPSTGGSNGISRTLASRKRHGNVQHFVPQYPSTSSTEIDCNEELSSGWQFISTPRDPKLHIPTLLAQHAYSLAVLHHRNTQEQRKQAESTTDSSENKDGSFVEPLLPGPAALTHPINGEEDEGMSYCIDWSRSDGIVIEGSIVSGLSCLIPSSSGYEQEGVHSDALLSKYRKQLKHASGGCADRVDVIQKTMLPADIPTKMCLRCGHITRKAIATANNVNILESRQGIELHQPGDVFASGTSNLSSSETKRAFDIGWVHRFDILCVCGGSWITI
ncbi:hypothetical protein GGI25_003675 [Coemansia spiralis]|uniref:Mediator of RNA polymerase II transcription subunit 16 n=2 Tax=Coemansia TaxID=4863 RepID=A0A9W8G1M0_9FUNG|nr:hypothetical protein GGI25_003675 [Coemansia spiralis]